DLITLGLSVAGMGMAGKSLAKDGKALKAVSQGNVNVKPAAVSNSTAANNSMAGGTGQFKMNLQMFAKSGSGTTLVTHRGTNEHIEKVLQQGYIRAYGPRTPIDAFIDHKNPAVWISEGRPTWFNRIFSGMVGKRGEASITFEVPSELIKKPSGIKKIFGKVQRVIEQDVEIPENVIVRKAGK
ncbi:MAG: hypothetical protein K2N51_13540, partial [Lachnospiraceae bacterium]|nr:hypothetical protein [Lachnospiraceae bacterium]